MESARQRFRRSLFSLPYHRSIPHRRHHVAKARSRDISGRHELILLPAWFPRACVVETTHMLAPRTLCAVRTCRTPPAPRATREHINTQGRERNRFQPRKTLRRKFFCAQRNPEISIWRVELSTKGSRPSHGTLSTVPASQARELDTQNRSRFNRLPQST